MNSLNKFLEDLQRNSFEGFSDKLRRCSWWNHEKNPGGNLKKIWDDLQNIPKGVRRNFWRKAEELLAELWENSWRIHEGNQKEFPLELQRDIHSNYGWILGGSLKQFPVGSKEIPGKNSKRIREETPEEFLEELVRNFWRDSDEINWEAFGGTLEEFLEKITAGIVQRNSIRKSRKFIVRNPQRNSWWKFHEIFLEEFLKKILRGIPTANSRKNSSWKP